MRYVFTPDGTVVIKNTLQINIAYVNRWDSYADYLNDIKEIGEQKDFVAKNLGDVLNHELGHVLTTPNNAGTEFQELYQTYSSLLSPLSANALVNANEALAEIFTAYRRGDPIDEDLLVFFNDYKNPDFPNLE